MDSFSFNTYPHNIFILLKNFLISFLFPWKDTVFYHIMFIYICNMTIQRSRSSYSLHLKFIIKTFSMGRKMTIILSLVFCFRKTFKLEKENPFTPNRIDHVLWPISRIHGFTISIKWPMITKLKCLNETIETILLINNHGDIW